MHPFSYYFQPFRNKKAVTVLVIVLEALFILGVLWSFICLGMARHNHSDYAETLPEINTVDTIDTVIADEASDRLFVCYGNASCVNAYTFDGEFVWAASVPSSRLGRADFALAGDYLAIDWGDTYFYDKLTGAYVKDVPEGTALAGDYEEYDKHLRALGFDYDANNVYRVVGGEIADYIVRKPSYYRLMNPVVGWAFAFVSGVIVGAIMLLSVYKRNHREADDEPLSAKARRRAVLLMGFDVLAVAVAVLDFVFMSRGIPKVFFANFGLTALFIILHPVAKLAGKTLNGADAKLIARHRLYTVPAWLISFISLIAATLIYPN